MKINDFLKKINPRTMQINDFLKKMKGRFREREGWGRKRPPLPGARGPKAPLFQVEYTFLPGKGAEQKGRGEQQEKTALEWSCLFPMISLRKCIPGQCKSMISLRKCIQDNENQ
jgi:hypothetical protein